MHLPALFAVLIGLAGCVALPDIADSVTAEAEAADYPVLRPRDEIIATVEATQSEEAAERAVLDARVRRLEARAAALQGSVIAEDEKDRLERGQE